MTKEEFFNIINIKMKLLNYDEELIYYTKSFFENGFSKGLTTKQSIFIFDLLLKEEIKHEFPYYSYLIDIFINGMTKQDFYKYIKKINHKQKYHIMYYVSLCLKNNLDVDFFINLINNYQLKNISIIDTKNIYEGLSKNLYKIQLKYIVKKTPYLLPAYVEGYSYNILSKNIYKYFTCFYEAKYKKIIINSLIFVHKTKNKFIKKIVYKLLDKIHDIDLYFYKLDIM